MGAEQSNTQIGDVVVLANEALTDKEGYLVKLVNSSGTPKAALPGAVTDLTPYLVFEGAAAGQRVTLRPLEPGRNVRLKLKGTCVPGDRLCLADTSEAADKGKVRELPADAGDYECIAVAEEVGADGQLVKCRHTGRQTVTVS